MTGLITALAGAVGSIALAYYTFKKGRTAGARLSKDAAVKELQRDDAEIIVIKKADEMDYWVSKIQKEISKDKTIYDKVPKDFFKYICKLISDTETYRTLRKRVGIR